ncbi:MAG: hypothetical protein AB1646_19715 [Thermodesulfobacteriota bacterium]
MSEGNPDRRIRGQILRMVRQSGSGVTAAFLAGVFRRAGDEPAVINLDENLAYLTDRGYLAHRQVRDDVSGVERRRYRITADGIDLIQGVTQDPGVLYVD